MIYKLGSCYKIKYHDSLNVHSCYIKNNDKIAKLKPPAVSQDMPLFMIYSASPHNRSGQQKALHFGDSQFWLGIDISLHSKAENIMDHPPLNKTVNVE